MSGEAGWGAQLLTTISASAAHVGAGRVAAGRAFPIVMALAFSHFLNDLMQSLVVYQVCAFLPAVGLLTALLPNLGRPAPAPAQ